MNTFVIAILLCILVCSIRSLPNGNQRTAAATRNSPETVSQRKCKEFSEIQDPDAPATLISDEDKGPSICPFQYGNSFVDSLAGPYEFPHLVLLGYESDSKPDDILWACTGNLISDQYVVTEAHCLVAPQGSPTYVRLGVSSVNDTQYRQEFNVEKVILHPDYTKTSYYNDIGLVKLDKKAKLNSKVKPICLPSEQVPDNKEVISAGFDLRSFLDSIRTEKVVKHTIKTLNVDVCNNNAAYKNNRRFTKGGLDNSQLCVGVSKEDQFCNEGSGWAAQIYNDKAFCTYRLIAMASFGKPCTTSKDPSVHTNVLPFVEWIEGIVWPEEEIKNVNDDTIISFPS